MKIRLLGEAELEVSELDSAALDVDPGASGQAFGSMQMFICGVVLCTHGVLFRYGDRFGISTGDLCVRAKWRYGDRPARISAVEMKVIWPSLPESRLDAATRAAHQCTLHNTLRHEAEVDTLVFN